MSEEDVSEKQRPVFEKIAGLHNSISNLEKAVALFVERVQPVCAPKVEPKGDDEVKEVGEKTMSGVSRSISDGQFRVDHLVLKIDRAINSLEV